MKVCTTIVKVEAMEVKSLNEVTTSLWFKTRQLRINQLAANIYRHAADKHCIVLHCLNSSHK